MAERVATKVYYRTAAALFVLLILTIALAYVPLGSFGPALALGIAALKAALVALYFMHLRFGPPVSRIFAGAALLWLLILFMTLGDYLTRP